MNTFQIDCFIQVAETLNFARAAERLNVTQPAVTHQIRSLEGELRVKLFRRTTRIVELTQEGILFLEDARNIAAISLRAKKRFENPESREIQPFSIGCHSYTHLFLLSDVLRQMALETPTLHPRLRVVTFPHLYRLLEEEEVDAIVGFQEANTQKIPGIYREFIKSPIVCVCPKDHPLAAHTQLSLSDLRKAPLILSVPGMAPGPVFQLQSRCMEGRPFSDFHFAESPESAAVLVKAGLGISLLPDLLLPADPHLARIPLKEDFSISFGVYHKSIQGRPLLKSFLDAMENVLQE